MMQMEDESRKERIREEAIRAKAIAVEKYKAGDLAGAKKFALKAKNIDPALLGLARLNAVLDVHMGFEKKINGEFDDWYAVLGVDPIADHDTIQRYYEELYYAMLIDSDNSMGSIDEANKILADARKNLCNEKMKQVYDKRRQVQLRLQNLRNVSPDFTATNTSLSSNGSTFWTTCHSCSLQYEYPKGAKNQRVVCAQCRKPFEAIEYPAPSMSRGNPWSYEKQQLRRASQLSSFTYIPIVLPAPKPQLLFDVKGSGFAQSLLTINTEVRNARGGDSKRMGKNLLHVNRSRTFGKGSEIISFERRPEQIVLTQIMLRDAFLGKAKSIINLILERYDSTSEQKSNAAKRIKCEISKTTDDMVTEEEEPNAAIMSVPDPDFYNFDKDRTEALFGENQVWAAYDTDGMPRFYALVHSVISQEPFKLIISWLNSKNNEELGPMKWVDSGFYKTSGRFWIGKRSNNESLNSFSHRVQWTKCKKRYVHIYPKKGDVWALYTNWSPSWGVSTPEEVVNKYEMVQVLQDFDEAKGVTVAPLVKIPRFQTVFRRQPNLRTFSMNELFRFSHQVASHLLTGQEGENAPEGCLELDPAAMSLELLKVFTEEEMRQLENLKPKEKVDDEAIKKS